MTLQVWTARISAYRGPGVLDVTRKSGGPAGHPFAPSWRILGPALRARRRADALRRRAAHDADSNLAEDIAGIRAAEDDELAAWDAYVSAFLGEMRTSYRANRHAWDALLARATVTCVCYCAGVGPALRCHRRLLAGILVRLGAADNGERP